MENLVRATDLAAAIVSDLRRTKLSECERLERCLSEIIPQLDRLKAVKRPWGSGLINALSLLQEALEDTQMVVRKYGDNAQGVDCMESETTELMTALRQLWQRQIELHLALQFQKVLHEDVDKTAKKLWEPLVPKV